MAEIKWIKITTTMFDDEKIDYIESLPEADSILVIWIKLLTAAGKCNAGGYIFLTDTIPYTEEMLAHKFKRPLNTVKLALATFVNLKMIEIVDGFIVIKNWEKHQNAEALEKIRESNRIRQQRYKASKLLTANVRSNVSDTVTGSLNNDLELDRDKELDLDKDIKLVNVTENERTILNLLKNTNLYPFDYEKDLGFIRVLAIDFPKLDLVEQFKKWCTYKLDHPLTKKSNPRSQIRNWFEKSEQWRKEKEEPVSRGRYADL